MNTALWIAQVLLALAFFTAEFVHAFRYERIKDRMKWMNDFSRRWVTFIGICEILGALGLILPAVTGILPWLTPLAALGLATIMVLAAIYHATHREYSGIITNSILFALAAFVAYGRFVILPL